MRVVRVARLGPGEHWRGCGRKASLIWQAAEFDRQDGLWPAASWSTLKLAEAQVLLQPGSVDVTGRREQSSAYVRGQVARVRAADSWMPRCGRRSPVALAEEVVDVLVGVCRTDELARRVAEGCRLHADTLASLPAGPDLAPVTPR